MTRFNTDAYVLTPILSAAAMLFLCAATFTDVSPNKHTPQPAKPELRGHITKSDIRTGNWEALYGDGDRLYQSGKYDEAYKIWAESLRQAELEQVWNKYEGPKQLTVLKELATMYKTKNNPAGAVKMYDMALVATIKLYGKDSVQAAQMMMEQSRMYTFYEPVSSYARADELLGEAFRINEKRFGRMTIPTGDVAIAMAQLREKEKRWSEAADLWKLAIDIGDRLEPNVVSCCRIGPRQGLARCYEQLGKLDRAIETHKNLATMCRSGARDMMPTVLGAYSSCLLKAGRTSEAAVVAADLKQYQH